MAPSASASRPSPSSPSQPTSDPRIEHVSDTALWVASYRALETERPDALFRDPLASVLVGERGRRIAASMPNGNLMAWVMAVRTVCIDRLIQDALAEGIDCVVNLGAGLDTRPYRMQLPAQLRWVEVDFPHMVDFKDATLANEKPVCALERIGLDLSDRTARQALFAKLGEGRRVLVITEGVIPYLTNAQAGSLAEDLLAVPRFEQWIQDFLSMRLHRPWEKKLKSAPFRFEPGDWFGFFRERGWEPKARLYTAEEGLRMGRRPPFLFPWSFLFLIRSLSRGYRERLRTASGYVRLKRVGTP